MQKRSDDRLVAYLDGELEPAEQREVDALLDSDPVLRDQLAGLALSAKLVRRAFDDVLREP
jgi:anti-sigma factor RsiW